MRVVLVDQSRAVQRAMTQLIEAGGHDVLSFGDARKALKCVACDGDVRALITSTQPDGMLGIELCAAARELLGSQRPLYVIMMSSTDDYGLVIKALDHGADDFMHKPPVPDELRARLRLADRVTSMQQELIRYASTDPLTGLLNRRAFFGLATSACAEAQEGRPLSAIMFDIDHFKRVNDTHGHEVGDNIFATVASEARLVEGIVGRLGGEEFCVLLHSDLTDALACAYDLQRSFRFLSFLHGEERFGITCSFGVAEWEMGDAIDSLLRRADMALYQAKDSGRDRIAASDTFALTDRHEEWRGAARTRKRHDRRALSDFQTATAPHDRD
jgi:two-component system, cell cycle response regulator